MQEVEIVMKRVLDEQIIEAYGAYLLREEKSGATVEKYLRDVRGLACCLAGGEVTKERIVAWKKQLLERGYAVRSVNSMLASTRISPSWRISWGTAPSTPPESTSCPPASSTAASWTGWVLWFRKKKTPHNLHYVTGCGPGDAAAV